jgi:hypothetical protein
MWGAITLNSFSNGDDMSCQRLWSLGGSRLILMGVQLIVS